MQKIQRVRFVSVSLDPTVDTPTAIARYRDFIADDQKLKRRFLHFAFGGPAAAGARPTPVP